MTHAFRLLGRGGALLAALLFGTAAFAQARDPATAEALFRAGREAAERGDAREACMRFRESQRLDPAAGTVLNIALCEEQMGELAAAWQHFQDVLSDLPETDDRRAFALEHKTSVDRRLPRVELELAPNAPPGTRVVRAGVELTPASFGIPIPIDPGAHVLEVTAEGREPRRIEFRLSEGEARKVLVEPGPVSVRGVVEPMPAPRAASTAPAVKDEDTGTRTLGYVVLSVGAAGILGSVVTTILALGEKGTVDDNCQEKTCNQDGIDAGDRGKRFTIIAIATGAVGVAATGVGVYLVMSAPGRSESGASLGLRGSF